MITVKRTIEGDQNRVTIEGHAYSGEPGHDLVCAAASILAYTLADNVQAAESNGWLREMTVELAEGAAETSCVPGDEYKGVVGLMFLSICAGFRLLAATHPENVKYENHAVEG